MRFLVLVALASLLVSARLTGEHATTHAGTCFCLAEVQRGARVKPLSNNCPMVLLVEFEPASGGSAERLVLCDGYVKIGEG